MEYKFIAQDEYDVIDKLYANDSKKIKDPVEVTITITMEKTRYQSVKHRRKTPLPQYIKDIFKPCK